MKQGAMPTQCSCEELDYSLSLQVFPISIADRWSCCHVAAVACDGEKCPVVI